MAINEWGMSSQGFYRPNFNDILDEKISKAQELFGEDIDTSETSAMGKFIRIGAYDLAKAYEDLELIYYSRFPSMASGISLDRLCPFVGIHRNSATPAQHIGTITGTAGATVTAGFVVGVETLDTSDENRLTFESVEDCTIMTTSDLAKWRSGLDTQLENKTITQARYDELVAIYNNLETGESIGFMTVVCSENGIVGNVGNNVIDTVINPDANVTAIVGSEIIVFGEEEESDTDLRNRFSQSLEGLGGANTNAIRSAILKVATVKAVGVVENDTDEEDEEGRPPHSFQCYVYGGDTAEAEQEIAETIFDKKPIGVTTCGDITKTVIDTSGTERTIKFSHTANITISVNVSIKTDDTFEVDGATQIKKNIADCINALDIGEDVILSTLYGKIHSVIGVTEVTSLTLSTNGTTYTASNVVISDYQVVKTTESNIAVTEVEV